MKLSVIECPSLFLNKSTSMIVHGAVDNERILAAREVMHDLPSGEVIPEVEVAAGGTSGVATDVDDVVEPLHQVCETISPRIWRPRQQRDVVALDGVELFEVLE
jgi:hypothetical protein